MNKLKQWVALTVAASLAVLAAGWFLLVSPKRAEATELQDQAASTRTANDGLRTKLAVLKAQAADLPKEQAKLAAVAAKIPDNPALPALIRALSAAADGAGVELVSLTPSAPVAQAAAPAATVDPETGTQTAAVVAPVSPLQTIPIVITVAGDYYATEQFLAALEDLPRALRVSLLTVKPGEGVTEAEGASAAAPGTALETSIGGTVYMAAVPTSVPVVAGPVTTPEATGDAPVAS